MFDMQVVGPNTPSYSGQDPKKVLAQHKQTKKKKQLASCVEYWLHFILLMFLVFLVVGFVGEKTKVARQRMAAILRNKWEQ